MSIKIPLPPITKLPNASAHGFPAQICVQTYEFMIGAMFYAIIADEASGQYVRLPNGLSQLKKELTSSGMDSREWDRGWTILEKYMPVFRDSLFQDVLIIVRSHWDWYIRQLASFVAFARLHVSSPMLSNKEQRLFDYLDRKEIDEQLSIMAHAADVTFDISEQTMAMVREMSLVRNLGLHNRWEVDRFYLNKTLTSGWTIGEIRVVTINDLRGWISSLNKLLDETAIPIAKKYIAAPDYP